MSKSSRVQSNLLQQNCFVRDCVRVCDLNSDSSSESCYLSLDEEHTESGFNFKKNLYSYPITPSYVNSFVDSSDYRRDPANAVANGLKRVNLGDCSDFQEIMNMDSSSLNKLYLQLKDKFSKSNSSDFISDNSVVDSSKNISNGGDNNA